MRLPDLNVLLHAANADSPEQAAAGAWLASAFEQAGGVAFVRVVLLGFLRISTRRAIFPEPLPVETALRFVDMWLAEPRAHLVHPTARHPRLLARLLLTAGTAGNLTTDAHLAALAIEHGATLGTFDRDFERFAGLDVETLSS